MAAAAGAATVGIDSAFVVSQNGATGWAAGTRGAELSLHKGIVAIGLGLVGVGAISATWGTFDPALNPLVGKWCPGRGS